MRFLGVSALLFIISAAATIVSCASMPAMGEMPMPGGWMMSMVWVLAPGETWAGAAASFLGLWIVMMVAMMLPSFVPMLWRYRQSVATTGEVHLGRVTALVGVGYFLVWAVFGMVAFPLGAALAAIEMQRPALARAVPIAGSLVILIAGFIQFTAWKARYLACCREPEGRRAALPVDVRYGLQHGMLLGFDRGQCCGNLMAILLVIGVMDIRVMAVVGMAITIERLAPALGQQTVRRSGQAGEGVARAIGAVVVATGVFLLARATALI
jgi:predicted metal-binding membrane protein